MKFVHTPFRRSPRRLFAGIIVLGILIPAAIAIGWWLNWPWLMYGVIGAAIAFGFARLMQPASRRESHDLQHLLDINGGVLVHQFPAIMDHVPEGITLTGGPPDFPIIFNSKVAIEMLGKSPQSLVGMASGTHAAVYGIYLSDGVTRPTPQQLPLYRATRFGESTVNEEFVIRRADGRVIHVLSNAAPIRDGSGRIVGAINCWRDVTGRNDALQALHKAHQRYRAFIANSAEGVWRYEAAKPMPIDWPVEQQVEYLYRESYLAECNDVMAQMYGYHAADEIVGMPLRNLLPDGDPANHEMLRSFVLSRYRLIDVETREHDKHGNPKIFLNTMSGIVEDGHLIRAWGTQRDITQRKHIEEVLVLRSNELQQAYNRLQAANSELDRYRDQLETLIGERTAELLATHERLRSSERMASLGTLAAGLGHDMGNLLLPISVHLDALRAMDVPGASQHIDTIEHCVKYLQSLTRGLRQLAQDPGKETENAQTDLATWMRDVTSLFKGVLPRSIQLQIDVPDHMPPIAIAPHALAQAVINLINNARDAIGAEDAGRVVLRSVQDSDSMVRVIVEDNGPGMPPEVRARAVEPFFTTKTRRLSTGLGLSLVHGIMNAVGGRIDIQSPIADGKGTAISLLVPIKRETAKPDALVDGMQDRPLMHHTDHARNGVASAAKPAPLVRVSVQHARTASLLTHVLKTLNCRVDRSENPPSSNDGPTVWLTDPHPERLHAAQSFMQHHPDHAVVVVGEAPPAWRDIGAVELKQTLTPSVLQEALTPIVGRVQAGADQV